jgi:REP element-mobilizing transposase RayT
VPDYILIVTPYHDFGEMLRLGLSESERYYPYLTHNSDEAILTSKSIQFNLAIIDTEMPDPPFRQLWQELKKNNPDLKLVLIFPEAEEEYPDMEDLQPLGCVDHLLYMPDFLDLIEGSLSNTGQPAPQPVMPPEMPNPEPEPEPDLPAPDLTWLDRPQLASTHLEDQLPNCSAQAALIARSDKVLAHTRLLKIDAAQEMADRFTRYWNGSRNNSDLVRFIHLGKDNQPYLLYATSLYNDVVLAALYQPDTPLSQPHSQISKLARLLLSEAPVVPAEACLDDEDDVFSLRMRMVTSGLSSQHEELEIEDEEDDMDGEEFNPAQFHLEELLSKMPPPDPLEPQHADMWQSPSENADSDDDLRFPWNIEPDPRPTSSLPFLEPIEEEEQPIPDFADLESASGDNPLVNSWQREAHPLTDISADDPLSENDEEKQSITSTGTAPLKRKNHQPHSFDEDPDVDDLDEDGEVLYAYTTFVSPLLKRHALTRELAQILAKSMSDICKKNGWKMVNICARPTGLLWTARIPASVSTGQMVKIVREETSDFLYELHPRLKYEALSENFWAPNYLVVSGNEPPDEQTIKDFLQRIHQTGNGSRQKSS